MKMKDLRRFAVAERMIPNAPVQASRTIVIDAPIEKVWALQTDVAAWPNWYPYLRNAKLSGEFGPGTKLSYGGYFGHNLTIAMVKEPEIAMIYGKLMGYSAVTRWELRRESEECTKVTFTESSVGFMIVTLYGDEKLGEHLQRWLEALKTEAERR